MVEVVYSIYQEWNRGTEFENNVREAVFVDITGIAFTSQTRIRIRCDASGNNDQIYIDDVVLNACSVSCTVGATCDDGDPNTVNDIYQPDCTCAGELIDCLGIPGGSALPGTTCDDGDPLTGNDLYQPDCSCSGQFIDCLGVPGGSALVGTSCDDGDPLTGNDIYQSDCSCSGVPVDCLGVPGGSALPGTTCDDGNPNTINDVYQPDCSCAGDLIDCLGVPGGPALPGTTCDDGDPNTINDVYQPDCSCAGDLVSPCNELISDGFESNFGNWNDGGNDCARNASNANTGSYSIRLRDNSGASSSTFTDVLDLSTYSEVNFDFSYITNSMENGEDFFLEISTNGGSSYSIYQEWNSGTEFSNNQRYNVSLTIPFAYTNNTRFRIRCDASGNNDQVYIDDVVIEGCQAVSLFGNTNQTTLQFNSNNDLDENYTYEQGEIIVYPNPASSQIVVELKNTVETLNEIKIYDINGKVVVSETILPDDQKFEINVSELTNGFYIVSVQDKLGQSYLMKFIKQ